jgi:oligopeptidase A
MKKYLTNGLPDFNAIKNEEIVETIKELTNYCKHQIDNIVNLNKNPNWETVVKLDEISNLYSTTTSPIFHLGNVKDSKDYRPIYAEVLELATEYGTWMGQNKKLYKLFKKLKDGADWNGYSQAQKMSIEKSLRGFTLSGIALPKKKKKIFNDISQELSKMENKFSQNVLDATEGWNKLVINVKDLDGVPQRYVDMYKKAAQDKNMFGWLIKLEPSSYGPVLQYCTNRPLRKRLYLASVTKASEIGPTAKKFDNTQLIDEILDLRHKQAKLLGFKNYANLSLATKMAESPEKLIELSETIVKKATKKANDDAKELANFAVGLGIKKMKPWDVAFVEEKLMESKYSFNSEQLTNYFPAEKVLIGLFQTVEKLFGITVTQKEWNNVWNNDVKCFIIAKDKKPIAYLYMDLYAREGKRGGAWMDSPVIRYKDSEGKTQLPVAYIVCNFTPSPTPYLKWGEINTLFHEFGHTLQHIVTTQDVYDVSGINGVPWDAVEIASQFMENWTEDFSVLESFSEHKDTKEKLPRELFDRMIESKNFMSGLGLFRQMTFGLLDMKIHNCKNPNVKKTLKKIQKTTALFPVHNMNRFPNTFTHIFAGGYSAGYYSYCWSLILAADLYETLDNPFDTKSMKKIVENIYETGGANEYMDNIKAVLGREPNIDAYLRQHGVI